MSGARIIYRQPPQLPSPTALLDLAPETENHQIKVPKVL